MIIWLLLTGRTRLVLPIFVTIWLGLTPIFALAENSNDGWNAYSRPDITSLRPKESQIGGQWNDLKRAHAVFAALLLESYGSDYDIYFLARDAETLYDVARLATLNSPLASKIHLLNVSRANLHHRLLPTYLAQNGITDAALRAGKKVLLVDTGSMGTIFEGIRAQFTTIAQQNIKAHFIYSDHREIPIARSFLTELNEESAHVVQKEMQHEALEVEDLPHFTTRSPRYGEVAGKIVALSENEAPEEALDLMQDLKWDWDLGELRHYFLATSKQIQLVQTLLKQKNLSAAKELKKLSSSHTIKALILDLLGSQENTGTRYPHTIKSLGLTTSARYSTPMSIDEVHSLIAKKDWVYLSEQVATGKLRDRALEVFLDSIYDAPATGPKLALQKEVLLTRKRAVQFYLADHLVGHAVIEMKEIFDILVRTASEDVLTMVVDSFDRQNTPELIDQLRFLIEKSDPKILELIRENVFKNNWSSNGEVGILRRSLKIGDIVLRRKFLSEELSTKARCKRALPDHSAGLF